MEGRVLVVLPTFNERENIREIVENLVSLYPSFKILVVDDASVDGTGNVADQLSTEFDNVDVMHRLGKRGRGAAVKAGLEYAVKNYFDFVVEMDADFSHNPAQVGGFLENIEGFDMVVGSRYVEGGRAVYDSRIRFWLSRVSNFFNKMIIGLPFMDVTCDFRCYRVESLRKLKFDSVKSSGFAFGVEFLYHAFLNGFRVKEIPIEFRERVRGRSKTDWRVILKYPLEVFRLKRNYSRRRVV